MPTSNNMTSSPSPPIIWVDCEMTGLSLSRDHIIEIAIIVTDWHLKELHTLEPLVIHVGDDVLHQMDEWNTLHHGESGLTEKVRKSTLSASQAQDLILDFFTKECKLEPQKSVMAGNSIHADRAFMQKDMPKVVEFLHYRLLDVSSFKLCAREYAPVMMAKAPKKKLAHRALDDIRESIEEFRFYKENFLKCDPAEGDN